MFVLGVSCDYHDSAAALVNDGAVVAAAEEERFSRRKHDSDLPERAIASCLASTGCTPDDLDAVVFHEKPLAVISRVIAARQRQGFRGIPRFASELPVLIGKNAMIGYRAEGLLRQLGATKPATFAYGEHHMSHAFAAFAPSPFRSAAILTIDGVGEWATATVGHGTVNRVSILEEQRYPTSLGLLYSLMTYWCGFEPNDGEYKLMGLAPFGHARFVDPLSELFEVCPDGSLLMDSNLAGLWLNARKPSRRLEAILEGPPLPPGAPLTQREADIARSIQSITESSVLAMAEHAHALTGEQDLCMAGGVALNCVANGRLLREGPFENIWIQPAAGDAGSALGAALWFVHSELEVSRTPPPHPPGNVDGMSAVQLGPAFSTAETRDWLDSMGIDHSTPDSEEELLDAVAKRLVQGAIVGWFQGRMEFGPRALGQRSILADPRSASVHRDLNLRVKGRESFRPFAPAVLWEHAEEWFDIEAPSPYMLMTFDVAGDKLHEVPDEPSSITDRVRVLRSDIPACTHVDGSARVQTVHAERSPRFHGLIKRFHELTECPVLLNTSFNRAGEPIVCTPSEAYDTAIGAGLDLLVLGGSVVEIDSDRVPT